MFLKLDDSYMGTGGSEYVLVDDQRHEFFHLETKHTYTYTDCPERFVGQ